MRLLMERSIYVQSLTIAEDFFILVLQLWTKLSGLFIPVYNVLYI